jgi:type I restriction enzyme S subunit
VLYGSRAKGTFKPGSDIDLTLIGDGLASQELAAIDEELDDLLLPYQIDLSIFDQLDHVKLHEHIERVGKVFYERREARVGEKAGWVTKTLGEVCNVVGGGTPPKDKPEFYSGDIPWATVRDLRQDVITETEFRITKDAVKSSATNIIPSGNVVIATRVGLGKVCLIGQDTAINQDLRGIVPRSDKTLVVRYLYWWLKSIANVIVAEGTGATVQGVKLPFVKSLQIPVPPLAEQQRIVGLLDEAFEGLAVAIANAEKNLQNARALFESHLQSVFTQRSPEWVEKQLGDLSRINYGYTESASAEKVGPHFLRITDIKDNGVVWDTVPYCPIDKSDFPKYKLADGDIVFARTGATTGKSYLVRNPPESVFASYLIRVQLSDKELLPQFVNLFFQTHSYWDTIRAGVSGSAQGGFNASKLGELWIPFPKSSKEQMSVVAKFDGLSEQTQRLAAIYSRKLSLLAALKKSLLHRAFAGEL